MGIVSLTNEANMCKHHQWCLADRTGPLHPRQHDAQKARKKGRSLSHGQVSQQSSRHTIGIETSVFLIAKLWPSLLLQRGHPQKTVYLGNLDCHLGVFARLLGLLSFINFEILSSSYRTWSSEEGEQVSTYWQQNQHAVEIQTSCRSPCQSQGML